MENIKLTPKRKEIIEQMNFHSLMEILRYYPYRYDIYRNETLSMSKHLQKVSLIGIIISKVKVEYLPGKKMKISFKVISNDFIVNIIMFNRFANTKFLYENAKIALIGKYNAFKNEISVSSFKMDVESYENKFIPIYSLPSNVKDATYRSLVSYCFKQACDFHLLNNTIPNEFMEKYKLVSFKQALDYIHNPTSDEALRQAYRYLKYEEFLSFCLLGALKRDLYTLSNGSKNKKIDYNLVKEFIYSLPFKLTSDQKNVLKEILDDMSSTKVMSRLLQGDVGSGKTIVALIALIANYSANYQGAIMAPTDILARQHYQSMTKFLEKFSDIKLALLVSDMSSKEKNQVLKDIANHQVDIIIGTHALIQDNVLYSSLGLAIIDEQHRFGVKQRVALKEKGQQIDVLYMSATPIPRTLASTIYMDMDVSTIATYPYQNRLINTYFINENKINKFIKEINEYLQTKQKIYVVCPSIEESSLEINNVLEIASLWQKKFPNYQVGVLHGKLSNDEKTTIMNKFINNEIAILVSTTVIEVGINVLDANMMIIYNAERFGLAQIHQLRGRIARDGQVGFCYLLSDSLDEDVIERLKFISSTNDGFKISEFDLKRRGAGDMLGLAQSGKSPFSVANLIDDFNILLVASKDAKYIIANKDKYSYIIEKTIKVLEENEKYVD